MVSGLLRKGEQLERVGERNAALVYSLSGACNIQTSTDSRDPTASPILSLSLSFLCCRISAQKVSASQVYLCPKPGDKERAIFISLSPFLPFLSHSPHSL